MIPRSYFNAVRIINDKSDSNPTENFYVVNDSLLIINDHKTSNVYKYKYIIPDYIAMYIRTSLENLPRRWLISKKDGTQYTSSALSSLVARVLGGLSINEYRHTIENVFIDKGVHPIPLARAMGHSVDTQLKHYLARGKKPPSVSA
eukprot:371169-Pleurochrysis_carterae.AAC.1